jgi:hypothetical protein
MAVVYGGAPKLSLLWKSPKFVDETGEGTLKKKISADRQHIVRC